MVFWHKNDARAPDGTAGWGGGRAAALGGPCPPAQGEIKGDRSSALKLPPPLLLHWSLPLTRRRGARASCLFQQSQAPTIRGGLPCGLRTAVRSAHHRAQRQTPERGFCSVYPSGHCSPHHERGSDPLIPFGSCAGFLSAPGPGDPQEAAAAPTFPTPRLCAAPVGPSVHPSVHLAVSGSAPSLEAPSTSCSRPTLSFPFPIPLSSLFLFLHFNRNDVPPFSLSKFTSQQIVL